jgi:cysteinyl-tRNA synthetase
MSLKVYNTLTGKKEEFVPLNPPQVKMYVCGVTVYDDCHLGHARGALTFDIISRYLKYKGYELTYVRNITDIDDKIIQRANELNCPWNELAGKYTAEYYKDMERLGIKKADIEPKATENIDNIIQMIQQLINKGYAYEIAGDVYFEVRKFAEYGKLSGRNPDDMLAGARIEVDERKHDPLDFALWKASKPGEPRWRSPWGNGRPGWHIECSVMSTNFLGPSLDIHGGGKDLIFPHHENEIAQSEAATGRPFVKYWLHNGFVQVDKEKMSKSLGNFFTIKDILTKYPAEVVRFFLLSTHYRSPIDFSDKRLEEAKRGLERFYNTFRDVQQVCPSISDKNQTPLPKTDTYRQRFEAAMDDDFNTAVALGVLFELVRYINTLIRNNAAAELLCAGTSLIKELGGILGLFEEGIEEEKQLTIPEEEIDSLINQRNEARANKDWATADTIRKKLDELGIVLEDRPEGTIWKVKI